MDRKIVLGDSPTSPTSVRPSASRRRSLRFAALLAAPVILAGLLPTGSPEAGRAAEEPHPRLGFAEHVRPILQRACASCHAGGQEKGGLSIETRDLLLEGGNSGPVIVPASSAESRLIPIVSGTDPKLVMPPKGDRLGPEEVAVLRLWIDQGAEWEAGLRLEPATEGAPLEPRRPTLPPALDGREHPVDRILDAYLRDRGLEPVPPADDATFLRRVTMDLVGLLPAPGELRSFLADPDPAKRDRAVARLLADRKGYAEHWLSFWNDLLRNDYEGPGYIDGGRKAITGWLHDSLLTNKPYDLMVRELIRPVPGSEGFAYGIKWRGRVNASQVPELQFAQNVSQVFLGINMKCASCHDSFVDRWKLADAYGLAAIHAEGPLELYRCDVPTGAMARPRFLFPEIGDVDPDAPREERLGRLADLMTSERNGRLARTIVNRLWARLLGRGIVEPVDAMDAEPFSVDLLDALATRLVDDGYDLKKALAAIATSRTYQARCAVTESEDERGFVFRGPRLKRMTAEQFVDAVWAITGTGPTTAHTRIEVPPEVSSAQTGFVRASLRNADALMRSLGRPNREQVVSTRPAVLTTLEALDLTNGPELASILERGAKTIAVRGLDSVRGIVADIYLHALSRPPTDAELEAALELVGSPPRPEGIEDLLWAVFMLPEFQLIH